MLPRDTLLETLRYETRHTIRGALRRPGFSVLVALTMALALGTATAAFTLVDATDFRPLPYGDSDAIVAVQLYRPKEGPCGGCRMPSPAALTREILKARAFATVAPYRSFGVTTEDRLGADYLRATEVVPIHFALLGARPRMGRVIERRDVAPDAEPVVVASHEFWRTELKSDVEAVGKYITLVSDQDGVPKVYRVVGVMPEWFDYPVATRVWVPRLNDSRSAWMLGRLRPGESHVTAEREVNAVLQRVSMTEGSLHGATIRVLSLRQDQQAWSGVTNRRFILVGFAALALVIAAINVSTLFLVRVSGMQGELATRIALGASLSRLHMQVAFEIALLVLTGAVLGLGVTYVGLEVLATQLGYSGVSLAFDARVVVLGLCLGLIVAVLIGGVIAYAFRRPRIMSGLRMAGLAGVRYADRTQSATIVLQTAGAVLFSALAIKGVEQFARMQTRALGFEPAGLVRIEFRSRRPEGVASGDLPTLRQSVEADVRRLQAIGMVHAAVEARTRQTLSQFAHAHDPLSWSELSEISVSPEYFRTIGFAVLSGRSFDTSDDLGTESVGIVSLETAKTLWPGESALGKRLLLKGAAEVNADEVTVVGVVPDVSFSRSPYSSQKLLLYRPFAQAPSAARQYWVRALNQSVVPLAGVFRAVADMRPGLPRSQYPTVHLLHDELQEELRRPRFDAVVFLTLAVGVLALAAVGAFGLVALSVRSRSQEIAVRIALGASRRSVYRTVAARGLGLGIVGVAIGSAAIFPLFAAVSRLIAPVQVPSVFAVGIAATCTAVVVLAATVLPVRDGLRQDVTRALRVP